MTTTITLKATGGSTTVVLPKAMLEQLQLGPGDQVFATATPQGILLSPFNAEDAEALRIAEQIMRENREAFAALAKI
jgi:putative addiction module antidote